MEKSNKIPNKVYPTPLEILEVEKQEETDYNETVQICSLIDAKVVITGTVTKTKYLFAKAGALGVNSDTGQVGIDIRDKDEILNKKKGRACCGGQSGKSLFQLV